MSTEELLVLNCGVGEDSWESLGLQEDPILKEISPECSLEGLMLKLKLQYFGHLIRGSDSLVMTLMLGKIEGRRRGWQRMRWFDGIADSMDMNLSKLQKLRPGVLQSMGSQRVGHDWVIELKVFFLIAPYVLTGQPQNISKSEWCQVFMQGENFNSFPPRVAPLSKLLINQLTLSYPLAVHHGSFSSIFTSWSPSVNRNMGRGSALEPLSW